MERGHQRSMTLSRFLYECKQCRRQTSVTTGTVFHRFKMSLPIWLMA